jgi:hypothetical protein
MEVAPGRWLPLNPETIEALPDAPGVFEIATLVRNVVQIGAGDGSLRQRIQRIGGMPPHLPACVGGYYVRFELTPAEAQTLETRLGDYRRDHGGLLPIGNRHEAAPTPLRAARRAA